MPTSGPTSLIIYTAIVGGYELLLQPTVVDPRVRYICFTDAPWRLALINTTVWELRKLERSELDAARLSRMPKILPHRFLADVNCDTSVWVDGNINIIGDVVQLVQSLGPVPHVAFKHPERECLYDEATLCLNEGRDLPHRITAQVERYRAEGFPARLGLTENNVIIRRHREPEMVNLMETWWQEVVAGSRRDQLSLYYALWRHGRTVQTMGDLNARGSSPVFRVRPGWRTKPHGSRIGRLYRDYVHWRLEKMFPGLK